MTIAEYEELVEPLRVDEWTRINMQYLEQSGQRFLVDFGYRNATEKVMEKLESYQASGDPS